MSLREDILYTCRTQIHLARASEMRQAKEKLKAVVEELGGKVCVRY